jgi:hypothetical protein
MRDRLLEYVGRPLAAAVLIVVVVLVVIGFLLIFQNWAPWTFTG